MRAADLQLGIESCEEVSKLAIGLPKKLLRSGQCPGYNL